MKMVKSVSIYNVVRFLTYFHRKGFRFIVLRGYEGLPDNYGGDLDIEVPEFQYQSFISELMSFSKEEALHLFRYVWRPHVTSFKFYRVVNGTLERFILDVTFRGGMWYGFQYLSNEELFLKARDRGEYLIPDPLHELCLKIFTNMLIGSSPPTKYLDELSIRLPSLKEEFLDFIRSRFPGVYGKELFEALVERDVDRLKHFIPKLKLALIKGGLRKQPLRSLKWMFSTIFAELYYYLQKNGLKVVLFSKEPSLYAFEGVFDELERMIGHVWKKVIFVKADEAYPRACRCLWTVEVFRDRLIIIVVPDMCSRFCAIHQAEADISIMEEPAEIVFHLYRTLEQRNRLRWRNRWYRSFLWRFGGYMRMIENAVKEE